MTRNAAPQQTLQQLPKKWAVAIVVALIAYVLVQPVANSRLGWSLPSLAGVLGMEKPTDKPAANKPVESKSSVSASSKATKKSESSESSESSGSQETDEASLSESKSDSDSALPTSDDKLASTPSKPTESQTPSKKSTGEKQPTSKPAESKQTNPDASGDLLYGLLKNAGREVYVSPAGLRYTRGSEEGHRLKHLEKHLSDIPDRPGKHGVFDGDMAQALRWIDDAYTRGKQGAKGVRKREEDGRTVYEVPFTKPIGYIGGRDGKRDKNPDAKRLRLVVDGDQVITAFPF